MQGDKQRALTVEALGNDNEIVGVEHLTRADDGIERTEARVIQHDIFRRHAGFDQIAAHGHRLVIALQRVVAAQQQIVDLAAVVGVQRPLDAVTVILVDDAGTVVLRGAKHDTHLAIGKILQLVVDIRRRFPAHPAVKTQHGQQQQAAQD